MSVRLRTLALTLGLIWHRWINRWGMVLSSHRYIVIISFSGSNSDLSSNYSYYSKYVALDGEVLNHTLKGLLADVAGQHGLVVGLQAVEAPAAEELLEYAVRLLGDYLYLGWLFLHLLYRCINTTNVTN